METWALTMGAGLQVDAGIKERLGNPERKAQNLEYLGLLSPSCWRIDQEEGSGSQLLDYTCAVNYRVSPDTFQENTALGDLDQHFLKNVPRNWRSAGLKSFCGWINLRSSELIKIKQIRFWASQILYHLDDDDDGGCGGDDIIIIVICGDGNPSPLAPYLY